MVTSGDQRIIEAYGLPLNNAADRDRLQSIKRVEDDLRFKKNRLSDMQRRGERNVHFPEFQTIALLSEEIRRLEAQHASLTNRAATPLTIDTQGHAQPVPTERFSSTVPPSSVLNSSSVGTPNQPKFGTGALIASLVVAWVVLK